MLAVVALAAGCTIARGDVKGLRDADATHIRFDRAIDTSITALNDLPSHCGPTRDHRVREEEFQVYRVIGTIRAVKRAPDHDIHIVLDDPDNPDLHVIVELPDPASRGSAKSPYQDKLALAMQMFEYLQEETGAKQWSELRGVRVRVTGVGFFDLGHFQVGRSRSCIELHPVLAIERFVGSPLPPVSKDPRRSPLFLAKQKRMTSPVTAPPYTGRRSEVPWPNRQLRAHPAARRSHLRARCARKSKPPSKRTTNAG